MRERSDSSGPMILEIKGSHFAVDGLAGAMTLKLYADHVETDQRVGLRHEKRYVPLAEVSGMESKPGKQWETLVIMPDSGDAIEVPGLTKEAVEGAIDAIEKAKTESTSHAAEQDGAALLDELADDEPDEPSVADRLRHLNNLRAEGAISEDEFSRRKAELFAS